MNASRLRKRLHGGNNMKRTLLALTVATVLGLSMPAIADAHHVVHEQSYARCTLVGTTPTIQLHVVYADFESYNTPAYFETYLDKTKVTTASGYTPKFSGTYNLDRTIATTPGGHDVFFTTTWPQGSDQLPFWVNCPASPTPTPTPTPQTPPTPPTPPTIVTVVYCNGQQMPPGTPPGSCSTPPKPKQKLGCPSIRLVMPNSNTLAGRHGTHRFGGRCSAGKIVSTTVRVTPINPGRPATCASATVKSRGAFVRLNLYNLRVFCHDEAWGRYRMRFVFTVLRGGHLFKCVKVAHFFDYDPKGQPEPLS
jgi:hypothetical protein